MISLNLVEFIADTELMQPKLEDAHCLTRHYFLVLFRHVDGYGLAKKVEKSIAKLPLRVRLSLLALIREIEWCGPVCGDWPNYSKLGANRHHCHLKKGHPAYVAVSKVREDEIRLVEVIYAGTHEKAPY